MITILNLNFEPAKKDFRAYFDNALIATGTVEFTNQEEHEKAIKMIKNAVATGYNCEPSKIYVTISKHY